MMLVGCGEPAVPEAVTTSSIVITEEGKVEEYLVDVFPETYYSANELEEMAKEEVSEYNSLHHAVGFDLIAVEAVEEYADPQGNRQVRLKTSYANANTYADYNEKVLFYGAMSEAQYLMGDNSIPAEYAEAMVVITNQPVHVYCPKKVKWVSGNYSIASDGSVDLTQLADGEKVAIVLAK